MSSTSRRVHERRRIRAQPIGAVTRLAVLLIHDLPRRQCRRAAAAARVLARSQQAQDARVVVRDDVDGAGARLGCQRRRTALPPLLVGMCTVSLKLIGVKMPLFSAASRRFLNASASSAGRYGLMSSTPNVASNVRRRVGRIRLRRPALLRPASRDFGTGRSSIGQIGSPVTRSNT